MDLIGEHRWRCPKTGLILISVPTVPAWRVFQAKYGSPVNPPVRTGPVRSDWSRFDLTGHATLYGAGTRRGSFIESLAYANYRPSLIPVHTLFPDVEPYDDPIAREWEKLSHMAPRSIPANWRIDRKVVDVTLHSRGYWVDVSASETVGALRRSAADWATGAYLEDPTLLDLAALTGSDRSITCAAAQWLSQQTPEDGMDICGVHYVSKHGADISCWAMWIAAQPNRQISEVARAATSCGSPRQIPEQDPDLRWAANQLGLVVW